MKPNIAFLITHGTDTMSWGLSFLTYSLKNCPHSIALVGSQRPMTPVFSSSDGYANIELAISTLLRSKRPHIFLAFDNGRKVFVESIWKKDKWDIDAFTGKIVAQKRSNEFLIFFKSLKNIKPLDELYIIRTGGTIEASVTEYNTLNAGERSDVVEAFIRKEFQENKNWIRKVTDIPLFSKDSSDLTINDWLTISRKIKEISNKYGYKTDVDEKFSNNVPIIFSSPVTPISYYTQISKDAHGIIFVGYGGGNVNIIPDSPYSPIKFFRKLKSEGKTVVLASHPGEGILDPVYENGAEVFRNKLAIPALDFSIAKAQVKLGFILANKQLIENSFNKVNAEKIIEILFLSGAKFANHDSRRWFESIFEIRIPEKDLLINRSFAEAVELAKDYLTNEKLEKIFYTYYDESPHQNYISILKLDEIVGENKMGLDIDSSKALANIIVNSFEWQARIVNLWEVSNYEGFFNFLKNSHIIFGRMGR